MVITVMLTPITASNRCNDLLFVLPSPGSFYTPTPFKACYKPFTLHNLPYTSPPLGASYTPCIFQDAPHTACIFQNPPSYTLHPPESPTHPVSSKILHMACIPKDPSYTLHPSRSPYMPYDNQKPPLSEASKTNLARALLFNHLWLCRY